MSQPVRVVAPCLISQPKPCYISRFAGGVPEWLKGADCKSVGLRLRWFESSLLHQRQPACAEKRVANVQVMCDVNEG